MEVVVVWWWWWSSSAGRRCERGICRHRSPFCEGKVCEVFFLVFFLVGRKAVVGFCERGYEEELDSRTYPEANGDWIRRKKTWAMFSLFFPLSSSQFRRIKKEETGRMSYIKLTHRRHSNQRRRYTCIKPLITHFNPPPEKTFTSTSQKNNPQLKRGGERRFYPREPLPCNCPSDYIQRSGIYPLLGRL